MRAACFVLVAACSFPTKNLVTGDGGSGSGDGSGSAVQHTLFVMGGGKGNWGEQDGASASIPDVISAPINADGSLGAWQSLPALPQAYVHGNPAVVADHFAYIIGEYGTPSSGAMSTVLFADLTGDQMWKTTTQVPAAQGGWETSYGAASDGNYVVLANMGGTAVWQTKVVTTGGIEAWTSAPAMPLSLSATSALIAGGNVYVLGGTSSSTTAVVYAPIGASGVGAWIDPNVSTSPVGWVEATVWQGHIYVIGGADSNISPLTTVWISTLGAGGAPGAFVPGAPLPDGRMNPCVIAGDKAVYVIGGEPGHGSDAAYDTVYYALPAPDGAIGSWNTTTALPSARSGVSCVIL